MVADGRLRELQFLTQPGDRLSPLCEDTAAIDSNLTSSRSQELGESVSNPAPATILVPALSRTGNWQGGDSGWSGGSSAPRSEPAAATPSNRTGVSRPFVHAAYSGFRSHIITTVRSLHAFSSPLPVRTSNRAMLLTRPTEIGSSAYALS